MDALETYGGQFCPEFEYEDWAIGWRSRLHALYLELANRSLDRAIQIDLKVARDVALLTLSVDPTAEEIERKLVWIFWHLGSRSAAATQFERLAAAERADGVDPMPLQELVDGPCPGT